MAKMLIHIGTGEDRKTYKFDEDRLMNVEAMAIERATGLPLLEILQGLVVVSMISVTSIVWILRRREEPGLQFEDVQFAIGDLDTGDVPDETEPLPKEEASSPVSVEESEPAPN